MILNNNLWVVSVGAQTSIGLDALTTVASFIGGIKQFSHNDFLRDHEQGNPFLVSELHSLKKIDIMERMTLMAESAINETLQGLINKINNPLPVILSIPSKRPGLNRSQQIEVAKSISRTIPCKKHKEFFIVVDDAHCSGIHALSSAYNIMIEENESLCLIGGVDSYMESKYLNWLSKQARSISETNPQGFIPGEGAGFLLLATDKGLDELGISPLAKIKSADNAVEPLPWYMGKATKGEGLTEALLNVLNEEIQTGLCYADLNGEHWRHEEWQFGFVRAGEYLHSPLNIRHPPDSYGDTGAASSFLLLIMALLGFKNPCETYTSSLVWSASDTRPWRSACVIDKC